MIIELRTIPHKQQRYDTLGDWYDDEHGILQIRASALGNPFYEVLILVHELIEAIVCRRQGISAEMVDNFDMNFPGDGEPGDAGDAPYFHAHQFASHVEKALAQTLGIEWAEYEMMLDQFLLKREEER